MQRLAIIDGIRTPFCKMGTALKKMPAQELGRVAVRELIERSSLDVSLIREVIFGNVSQPADAANIARVIALESGIPDFVPAYTVHRNCASGMEALFQADMKAKSGRGDCFLIGGTESMSQVPFFFDERHKHFLTRLSRAKSPIEKLKIAGSFRLANLKPRIGLQLGLTDPVCGLNMGQTAEVLAKEFGISRKEQDEFALRSHHRAAAARDVLREEMMTVFPPPNYKPAVEDDIGPREHQSLEALAKLKPVFDRSAGTVTAGNSSQITDGAVALWVMTEDKAKEMNLKPLGYMRDWAVAGVEPQRMGIGPAHAIPQVLHRCGMAFSDIQAFEINEAFAAQVIACQRSLQDPEFARRHGYDPGTTGEIPHSILNIHGGAIALGHPVGSTGARLVLTMLKHLRRADLSTGLVSLCVGGGQGAAIVLERH